MGKASRRPKRPDPQGGNLRSQGASCSLEPSSSSSEPPLPLSRCSPTIVAILATNCREARPGREHFCDQTLGRLAPATLLPHADVVLASLEDSGAAVRRIALKALGRLDPATLAQHSDAVVARLDDSEAAVRKSALETLAALEPTALCHYAAALGMGAKDADEGVREVALAILRSLKGHVDLSETQSKLEPLELEE